MKGNVIDLAVAVIVGGAFGKIVSSLVADVVMPLLGLLLGGVNFTDIKIVLKKAVGDNPELVMNIGVFIQNVFDFLVIAAAIFVAIKLLMRLRRIRADKKEDKDDVPKEPELSNQEKLLTEIRDLLKK